MRLLLDTHAFVWWTLDQPQLSAVSRATIASADTVAVSVATAWEIAIKVGKGKWPEARLVIDDFESIIQRASLEFVPITVPHVRSAGLMVAAHRDPFDRLLAAQAMFEGMTLVTADGRMPSLGATCLW